MTTVAVARSQFLKPLVISNGTVEALKWLALLLMTCDHINKYLLNDSVVTMFDLGRVAMPLFAFVLAYNFLVLKRFKKASMGAL